MNPSFRDPEFPPTAAELLSAAFDNEADFDVTAQRDSAGHDEQLQQWAGLSRSLRQLPVQPAPDLRPGVRAAIDAARRQTTMPVAGPAGRSAAGSVARSWLAVCVSAVAVLLLVGLPFAYQPGDVAQDDTVQLAANATPAGQAADSLAAGSDLPHSEAAMSTASAEGGQPDWQIVIVTVPDDAAEFARRYLQTVAEQPGVSVERLQAGREGASEFPLGILLSSEDESNKLLDSLAPQHQGSELQWNPVRVGDLDSSELKRRFLQSMQTPTRSEEYFGEMYTVVTGANGQLLTAIEPADAATRSAAADSAAVAAAATGFPQPPEAAAEAAVGSPAETPQRSRPVLVVFRKTSQVLPATGPVPDQSRLVPRTQPQDPEPLTLNSTV